MIDAIPTGWQRTACLPYLAAPANCSVNRAPSECKRALFTWPVVGEEEGNVSIALHGFLMMTGKLPFCCCWPVSATGGVQMLVSITIGGCITAEFQLLFTLTINLFREFVGVFLIAWVLCAFSICQVMKRQVLVRLGKKILLVGHKCTWHEIQELESCEWSGWWDPCTSHSHRELRAAASSYPDAMGSRREGSQQGPQLDTAII